jgi:PKD repeat protein
MYTVSLTVTGSGGSNTKTEDDYITVTEAAPPVAQFTASTTNGLAPLSVTFTDTSTGNPTSWKWEYRNYDGSWTEFSTAQSPTQSFSTPGTYDIRLTVTKGAMSDDETKTHLFAVSGGREPLVTVASGTVSGDLYMGAFQTVPFANQPTSGVTFQEFDQSFSLPASAIGNIQWARLFVTTYGGSAGNNYGHRQIISFDGNGDGTYETTLGAEDCDIAAEGNGNSYPLNDHVTKVFSDYGSWYDVTSLITAANPAAHVRTEPIAGITFDGRLKAVTLVAAYNDGDTDTLLYWVNFGHDWINSGTTQTAFATSSVTPGFTSATGRNLATSSRDGRYSFNGVEQSWADPVPPVNYFDFNTWDLKATNAITPGSASILVYSPASGQSFKNVLSTVTVKYTILAPVADFTPADPVSGDKPFTVVFTDASTGSITVWDMDFGDGSTHGSGPGPWSHQYTTRGTYDVSLTVTGPGGTDTKTRIGHVQVKEPAPVVDFTPATQVNGVEPLTVTFDATNTGGAVTSWKWERSDDSGSTWAEFATIEDPQDISFNDGTWSVRMTATGPDYSDTETKSNIISVGASDITVTVSPASINFGTMQAGVDETGSRTVNVDVTGGTAWSVGASASNDGYMGTGTVNLASPFQLSNDGTNYQAMTSPFANFLTGAAGVDGSDTADVKQAIAAADAPGAYTITVTFTGGFV